MLASHPAVRRRWVQLILVGLVLLVGAPARAAEHAIVVFGAPPRADGSLTPLLERRLEAALDQARRDPAALVVVTGGTVRGALKEGEVMARWLRERGVARGRLRIESRARHTGENADMVMPILRREGIQRVTVVTDKLHLRRAMFHMRSAVKEAGLRPHIALRGVGAPNRLTGEEHRLRADRERQALSRDIRLRRAARATRRPGQGAGRAGSAAPRARVRGPAR